MAGSSPGFDADAFNEGIRFAMRIGLPVETAEQPTFHFQPTRTHLGDHGTGLPFDPGTDFAETEPTPVQVDCAIEFFDEGHDSTSAGPLNAARVEVTLLREEYELVKDAYKVVISGDSYRFRFTEPEVALFDSGVRVMHFYAENER